jgi:hypothetical protein
LDEEKTMSQHYIPAKTENTTVIVGYDRPLDHFFATIFVDGDVVYFSDGTDSVVKLRKEIAPYADLSVAVAKELVGERAGTVAHPMIKCVDHRPQAS